MKKVVIFISMSVCDADECVSHHIKNANHITEESIVTRITGEGLHALCKTRRKKPLFDAILREFKQTLIDYKDSEDEQTLVFSGSIFLHNHYENEIRTLANELGVLVEISGVYASIPHILAEGVRMKYDFREIASEMDLFSARFDKQYVPRDYGPIAIVFTFDRLYRDPERHQQTLSLLLTHSGLEHLELVAFINDHSITSDDIHKLFERDSIYVCETFKKEEFDTRSEDAFKLDVFWNKIVPKYNIQYIIEDDASSYHRWRNMGVDAFFTGNLLAFHPDDTMTIC